MKPSCCNRGNTLPWCAIPSWFMTRVALTGQSSTWWKMHRSTIYSLWPSVGIERTNESNKLAFSASLQVHSPQEDDWWIFRNPKETMQLMQRCWVSLKNSKRSFFRLLDFWWGAKIESCSNGGSRIIRHVSFLFLVFRSWCKKIVTLSLKVLSLSHPESSAETHPPWGLLGSRCAWQVAEVTDVEFFCLLRWRNTTNYVERSSPEVKVVSSMENSAVSLWCTQRTLRLIEGTLTPLLLRGLSGIITSLHHQQTGALCVLLPVKFFNRNAACHLITANSR